ncbi:FRG domain-containing protein [Ramlibacter sp. MMS24-I3-19]|uniref:FRG domain-containing protein n=1 Tax=Ramlibacter sp. MMS24-I3-19 TaxID=3416606 RepID=UPI003CFC6AF0
MVDIAQRVQPKDPGFRGVWRGQVRQHTTEKKARTPEELLRLYGSADVQEPSLLPSAARTDLYFPDSFAAWSALLDVYVHERAKDAGMQRELLNFVNSYRYRLWGFATAQHYGLPSVGLDVTHDINVALFFALHSISTDKTTGVATVARAPESESPIIYGLGGFADHELLPDDQLAPMRLLCARPSAQAAMFFSTGWGHAPNYAAQRIYVAVRLIGHSKWKFEGNAASYFPNAGRDEFLAFLLDSKRVFQVPSVQDLLSKIYYIP